MSIIFTRIFFLVFAALGYGSTEKLVKSSSLPRPPLQRASKILIIIAASLAAIDLVLLVAALDPSVNINFR